MNRRSFLGAIAGGVAGAVAVPLVLAGGEKPPRHPGICVGGFLPDDEPIKLPFTQTCGTFNDARVVRFNMNMRTAPDGRLIVGDVL